MSSISFQKHQKYLKILSISIKNVSMRVSKSASNNQLHLQSIFDHSEHHFRSQWAQKRLSGLLPSFPQKYLSKNRQSENADFSLQYQKPSWHSKKEISRKVSCSLIISKTDGLWFWPLTGQWTYYIMTLAN